MPASEARYAGYPGFAGLGLPPLDNPEKDEPYIYHFPDGNASLARLLVRSLVPAAAPGSTMDDVVLAPFDYGKLDVAGSNVRIRLDSTCVDVRNVPDGVELGYVRDGKLHRVAANDAVLACFNMVIPYIMPDLPQVAVRGAGEERQGAAGLQQGSGAQLAALGEARRARDQRADVDPTAG